VATLVNYCIVLCKVKAIPEGFGFAWWLKGQLLRCASGILADIRSKQAALHQNLVFHGLFLCVVMAQVVDMAWDSSWLTCYLELMNLDPNRRIVPFVIGKIVVVQIWLNWPFMNYG
jgi:hypothetical protein